ncbi:MAG: c-type cytochrome [Polyangiaceae bacterium]
MLSKSGAKAFFLVGTFACSAVFIGLTVDSFARIPAQTHAEAITPAVKRGKDLWDENNCMGCHTLFGEGAYYAPELTRVHQRRGPEFIRAMLRDPEAMYPGQRKMQRYKLSADDIEALVAFFAWAGRVDLNGFPPTPNLIPQAVQVGPASGAIAITSNRPLVFNQLCIACHALGGQGGAVGPALDLVGDRRDAAYIGRWLKDPMAVKPDSKMPKLPLSDDQVDELVAFLSQQKTEPLQKTDKTEVRP